MKTYKVLILGLVSLSLFASLRTNSRRKCESTIQEANYSTIEELVQGKVQEAVNYYSFPDVRKRITEPESRVTNFDSLNCRFVGSWPFGPSYAVSYDSIRNLAFCSSAYGVYIFDSSNPSSPRKISEAIRLKGIVQGLFYKNNHLYIAACEAGLEIWDIRNPESPVKLGCCETPSLAADVYVYDSYAYVGNYDAGLRIIDISNPSNPYEVGYYDTRGSARRIFVEGNFAYVADGDGLAIIDISNPSNPFEAGYYDSPSGVTCGVYIFGSYAYIADGPIQLRIIDISDPSNPFQVGGDSFPGWAWDIYVSDTLAYIADEYNGLLIENVSNPSYPYTISAYRYPEWFATIEIYVSEPYAYVIDYSAGFT